MNPPARRRAKQLSLTNDAEGTRDRCVKDFREMLVEAANLISRRNGRPRVDVNEVREAFADLVRSDRGRTLREAIGDFSVLIAAVFIGFGVNFLTGTTQVATGWVSLCAALVVGALAIFIEYVKTS